MSRTRPPTGTTPASWEPKSRLSLPSKTIRTLNKTATSSQQALQAQPPPWARCLRLLLPSSRTQPMILPLTPRRRPPQTLPRSSPLSPHRLILHPLFPALRRSSAHSLLLPHAIIPSPSRLLPSPSLPASRSGAILPSVHCDDETGAPAAANRYRSPFPLRSRALTE